MSPNLIRLCTLTLIALCAPGYRGEAHAAPAPDPGPGRPNIILVLADDLGLYELGCYGQEKIRTPQIDRLAHEGMRFERFYSASTVCAPSRASLLTGLHTGHAPIRGNREVGGWGPEEPEGQHPIPDGSVTLAERLKDLGYATAAFGKWGLGGPGSAGHPNAQGFDHFYGYLCQRVAHNYYPTHLWRGHEVDVLHGNSHFGAHQRIAAPLETDGAYRARYAGDDYAPEEIALEAEAWIAEHNKNRPGDPFFLYYASVIPHVALQAPAPYIDRYPRAWDPEPYLGDRGYLPTLRPRATYAAMISFLDDVVGRLRAAVEASGDADNTLILVTSDNGTTFNGGVDRAFFRSLGDLRGHKTNLYEGGIRVPMIAWWPGRIEAGTTSDIVAQLPDLFPTAVEAAGGDAPESLDGISLMPTLLGDSQQRAHSELYWEFPEGRQQQAVLLDGRWKAIRPDLKRGLAMELYDLATDPGETSDLAHAMPVLVERARLAMARSRTVSDLFPIPALDEGP